MGDRANVAILRYTGNGDEVDAVVFYTHWGGTDLPIKVKTALARNVRWTDSAYLARIVFCGLVDSLHGETGYGITVNALDDNDGYDVLVLDPHTERIASRDEDDWRRPVREPDGIPFAEYIRLSEEKCRAFRR